MDPSQYQAIITIVSSNAQIFRLHSQWKTSSSKETNNADDYILEKYITYSVMTYSCINTGGNWKKKNCVEPQYMEVLFVIFLEN